MNISQWKIGDRTFFLSRSTIGFCYPPSIFYPSLIWTFFLRKHTSGGTFNLFFHVVPNAQFWRGYFHIFIWSTGAKLSYLDPLKLILGYWDMKKKGGQRSGCTNKKLMPFVCAVCGTGWLSVGSETAEGAKILDVCLSPHYHIWNVTCVFGIN